MNFTTLISTNDLEKAYTRDRWILVDCRFDLSNKEIGFSEYQKAHIPGAVYAHLDNDLAGPLSPHTGRHPLPEPASVLSTFSRLGIDTSKQVIVYDSNSGGYAGRLWWMLRHFGHINVAVLDGGFPKWQRENRATISGIEQNPPAQFLGQPDLAMIASAEEVNRFRKDPSALIIDARTPERYRGEIEPIDPVAGHIPGAVNRFHGMNLTPEGIFKSPEQLREEFMQLLNDKQPQNVVAYCGSGVTAIHNLLAMEIAGLPAGRLYPGSWSEWIRDPNRPIATGE